MTAATLTSETPQQAARRLLAGALREGFEPAALHCYADAHGEPLFWRARLRHPDGRKAIRPIRWSGERFELGEPPAPPDGKPLYRLNELAALPGDPVAVVEGESCADALAALGLLATTSGGADSAGRADWQPLAGRDVSIWRDNDEAGARYAAEVAERLRALDCHVRLVDVAALALPPKGDAVDWLAMHPDATDADVLALATVEPPAATGDGDPPPMAARCLANVKAEPVCWLWPGRIARGKVTVLAGNPGLGKSQITASLAAIVATAGQWPIDRTRAERGAVAFLTAEDDAADTLVPRLKAAGADLSLSHVLDAVRATDREGLPTLRGFDLSRDVSALAEMLTRIGDVRLLVIDPISAYLGGVDSHRNAEVRALLAPLSDMAAALGVAVVAVSHLNKGGGSDALSRVTGSLAFVAAARAAWIVAKDPQDPARRLFLPAKNNLGPDGAGLSFAIEAVTIEGDIETSRIAWHAEPVTITANEALAADGGPDRREEAPQRKEAEEWLAASLSGGPVPSADLLRSAGSVGISRRTLFRAKEALGVAAAKGDFKGGWVWRLPDEECHLGAPRMPAPKTLAPFAESKAASGSSARLSPKSAPVSGVGTLGSTCTADDYRRAAGKMEEKL